jgi:uncharacterized protein with GYD domain
MATFVLLSSLTDEGAKTIKQNPARIKQVNDELAKMGVKVVSQWAVLGNYDFVNVVEAPDNTTIARVSAELLARDDPDHDAGGDPNRRVHRRTAVA